MRARRPALAAGRAGALCELRDRHHAADRGADAGDDPARGDVRQPLADGEAVLRRLVRRAGHRHDARQGSRRARWLLHRGAGRVRAGRRHRAHAPAAGVVRVAGKIGVRVPFPICASGDFRRIIRRCPE